MAIISFDSGLLGDAAVEFGALKKKYDDEFKDKILAQIEVIKNNWTGTEATDIKNIETNLQNISDNMQTISNILNEQNSEFSSIKF